MKNPGFVEKGDVRGIGVGSSFFMAPYNILRNIGKNTAIPNLGFVPFYYFWQKNKSKFDLWSSSPMIAARPVHCGAS